MNEDGFTLIKGGRQAKKRKAEESPQLNSPPGASTASPSNTPARPKPSSFKNVIPVILSDVGPKFSSKVKLMSELKQFHPNIKVSKVLEKNNDFLIIGDNPHCPITGIIYKVEEFRTPISVQQCYNCQCLGHSAKKCRSKTKCLICGEDHHHEGCPNKETKQAKCANCNGPHVASYKGVQHTKNRHLGNMWWTTKIISLNSMPKLGSSTTPR